MQGVDDVLGAKHVLHEPVLLVLMKALPVCGDHARAVLAPVLQHEQPLIKLHICGTLHKSTHMLACHKTFAYDPK